MLCLNILHLDAIKTEGLQEALFPTVVTQEPMTAEGGTAMLYSHR